MILVVDDDVEIRQALTDVLEDEHYTVVCAANGREAIAMVEEGLRPDLILLDVMMPVMDGWHFLSARLAYPQLVEIPIIIISAGMEAAREAKKVGVCDVIRKPLHISSLVEHIEECRRVGPQLSAPPPQPRA
jgi:CheY-like chemotaxis protein